MEKCCLVKSLDFCCDIGTAGSEYVVNNMKAWIHPALYQRFRLGWGIFSCHTLGPLVPIEHCLKATAYLSIVSDDVHPFITTVYPSSDGYFRQDNTPFHKNQIISNWFLDHERLASWMYSRQICSNCQMLSSRRGSNPLLTRCT